MARDVRHRRFLHDEAAAEEERPGLSVLQMRQVVLDAQHHAAAHEPRVWDGEKDSVQALLQEVPAKVEPGTAPEANPPETIQTRPAECHQEWSRAGRE